MLRLYESRYRYKEGESVATWIFTMAYNLCKNQYRHLAYEQDYLAQLDAYPTTESQVEVQIDRRKLEEALQQVLASLSPPLRMLFSLKVGMQLRAKWPTQEALPQTFRERLLTRWPAKLPTATRST